MDGQPIAPEPNESIDQFKTRVERAVKERKKEVAQSKPKTIEQILDSKEPSAQSSAEAPKPSTDSQPAPGANGAGQAEDGKSSAPGKQPDKREIDVREWARNKGIKDEESALRSLRSLEQELHRRNFESKKEDVPRGTPAYPLPPNVSVPQTPPQYPPYIDRQKILEAEAARYGVQPQDLDKVIQITNDIFQIRERQMKQEYDAKISEITRETRRNSELNELMRDPLFTNQEIQFEMHQVLQENPRAYDLEPLPYVYAFGEAQKRVARRYLQKPQEPEKTYPNNPPKSGSTVPNKADFFGSGEPTLDKFRDSKIDEQRKILDALGVRKTY